MNVRTKAALILSEVIQKKRSLTTLLPYQRNNKEQSLLQELCYGVLRWYFKLKIITEALLHSPLKNKDHDIFCLLLVGFYQLNYLKIPPHVIVSQTVEAAQNLKKPWAKGLINKLLRRFISEKEKWIAISEKTLEGKYAHPEWFIQEIKSAWPDLWEDILEADNHRPPLTLRVNLTKISRDNYLKLLKENRISAQKSDPSPPPTAIYLKEPCPVYQLPGFDKGYCSVQDISGQYAAYLLNLENDQTVLDACAAPGSKTTHILELNYPLRQLIAIDKIEQRLTRIKENIIRLDLSQKSLRLIVADAAQPNQWAERKITFDRILLDAPCSASGVIRRHPDIKLLRQPSDITQYYEEQLRLLSSLWPLLNPGGALLYSTCSVLPDENEKVINAFLTTQQTAAQTFALKVPGAISLIHGIQLLPGQNGGDGFYYALLKKIIP
ncbi:16S rRNA (cytosine(967)-C(5))-methyltransferase RsmB [Coxiella-like endosymbiont]|uniref:16S rRNA (cytosine(967)-C(5))-methyltransferase RsmB n=1 Tax=Coxiella-like endosymbiont TaxID=1592897 RepID=UPI00272B60AE|nr:16S rRNA (cytosine(967)-C(5))-methyltransferase RsmB [Coxiella-like endosymbiont]